MDTRGLAERVKVQTCDRSILEAIFTVVAHFAEHTGHILFATKLLTQQDLGSSARLNAAGSTPKK